MVYKKLTSLLSIKMISIISKYVNCRISFSTCIICGNNQNKSMNGNQQVIAPSELISLWLFAKVKSVVHAKISLKKNYIITTGVASTTCSVETTGIHLHDMVVAKHLAPGEKEELVKRVMNEPTKTPSKFMNGIQLSTGELDTPLYEISPILSNQGRARYELQKVYNEFNINKKKPLNFWENWVKYKVSELDFMLKLWSEVLELLFGDGNSLYNNWGETVPETTTTIKRKNNDNKAHTIGCKVDGRVVCKLNKVVDTCHIEAAKASVDYAKIYSDKFKLAVESKCTIDDIVMSEQIKGQKYVPMYSMQVYGLQAEVSCLKFVDRGFYVNTSTLDLSLMNNLESFSKNMLNWVKQLLTFKKMCVNVSSLSTQAFNKQQSTFADLFQRNDDSADLDKYCNSDWQIITSANIKTQGRPLKKKHKEVVLEDGTIVISKFNKDKESKRKSHDIIEKAKNETPKRN